MCSITFSSFVRGNHLKFLGRTLLGWGKRRRNATEIFS